MSSQRSKVVNLYKTLLHMGRDYPQGYEFFRDKCKKAFLQNRHETDPKKIKRLIGYGNYYVKELEALYALKKYRTLKKMYYSGDQEEDCAKKIDQILREL